ncbi:TPA: hypothetical protein RQO70_004610 [Klebsiella michiganensis]|nr:hypothetical protein [Klebsiella michiganensis]HDX9092857.1 hypothetical protein [Klebsiella michiganensis]
MNVSSPVALTLTGATVLHGLVARPGASSAASGEIPVALALTGATALHGLVARTGASSAASGEIPGCAYQGYGSAWSGSPDRRVKRRLRENPRSRLRLPGLQLCAVWSPGQARQAPLPGKSPVALALTGATALRGLVARTGASSAASGEIPVRAYAYRGNSSARSGRPDRRVKRHLPGNPRSRLRLPGLQLCAVW